VRRIDEWLAGVLEKETQKAMAAQHDMPTYLRAAAQLRMAYELLQLHMPGGSYSDGNGTYDAGHYCGACGSGEPYTYPVTWPCETLRVVAYGYRWALGWREEWAPASVRSGDGL